MRHRIVWGSIALALASVVACSGDDSDTAGDGGSVEAGGYDSSAESATGDPPVDVDATIDATVSDAGAARDAAARDSAIDSASDTSTVTDTGTDAPVDAAGQPDATDGGGEDLDAGAEDAGPPPTCDGGCNTPPDPGCQGSYYLTYDGGGQCSENGVCFYIPISKLCPGGCFNSVCSTGGGY